jgi:hypothetical protein
VMHKRATQAVAEGQLSACETRALSYAGEHPLGSTNDDPASGFVCRHATSR